VNARGKHEEENPTIDEEENACCRGKTKQAGDQEEGSARLATK